MQHYTIFFIIVNALHVSGGFSAHHQELKKCKHSIGFMLCVRILYKVASCLLYLKEYIKDARSHERQIL